MTPNQTTSNHAEHELGTRAVAVDWHIAAAGPLKNTHLLWLIVPVASSAACTRFNLTRMKELSLVRSPVGLVDLNLDAVYPPTSLSADPGQQQGGTRQKRPSKR